MSRLVDLLKSHITEGILGLIFMVLTGIYLNTRDVPQLKRNIKATQDSLFAFIVDVNTKVYLMQKYLERQRIIDSIHNAEKK